MEERTRIRDELMNIIRWLNSVGFSNGYPNIGFEFDGVMINFPLVDKTGKIPVDPIEYYGVKNIREYIRNVYAYQDEIESNTKAKYLKLRKGRAIVETYAPDTDMTFIMVEKYVHEKIESTECVGWYFGEPDEELTKQYFGKLKAKF